MLFVIFCPIACLVNFWSVLWCPIWLLRENGVWFVFLAMCLVTEVHVLVYTIYIYLRILLSNKIPIRWCLCRLAVIRPVSSGGYVEQFYTFLLCLSSFPWQLPFFNLRLQISSFTSWNSKCSFVGQSFLLYFSLLILLVLINYALRYCLTAFTNCFY